MIQSMISQGICRVALERIDNAFLWCSMGSQDRCMQFLIQCTNMCKIRWRAGCTVTAQSMPGSDPENYFFRIDLKMFWNCIAPNLKNGMLRGAGESACWGVLGIFKWQSSFLIVISIFNFQMFISEFSNLQLSNFQFPHLQISNNHISFVLECTSPDFKFQNFETSNLQIQKLQQVGYINIPNSSVFFQILRYENDISRMFP